jgi:hypothetical protein
MYVLAFAHVRRPLFQDVLLLIRNNHAAPLLPTIRVKGPETAREILIANPPSA